MRPSYKLGVSRDRSHLFKLKTADTNYSIACVARPLDAVPSQPDPRPASSGCLFDMFDQFVEGLYSLSFQPQFAVGVVCHPVIDAPRGATTTGRHAAP